MKECDTCGEEAKRRTRCTRCDLAAEFLTNEVQDIQAKTIGELKLYLHNAKQRIRELEEELRDERGSRGNMPTLDSDGVQQTL